MGNGSAHVHHERVEAAGERTGCRLHRQPLPRPILEAPDHLADGEARASEFEGSFRPGIAARAPAVHHDGRRGIQLFRSTDGDVAVGHVDRALRVALVPGILAADVDEDESLTGLLCGVDVGRVGFVVEFR